MSTNRSNVYDSKEVSLLSSHLSLVEIAGDFGSRPYRAIRAVFCLLPFLHCGIASVHGENLEKETKEH